MQDMFQLLSPGGGGFGTPENDVEQEPPSKRTRRTDPVASHHYIEKGSVYAYKLAQESA